MTRARQRQPFSVRLFRALLVVYPGEFRDECGREVAMVFADRYRDATSVWQRIALWVGALAGLLREAPKEHLFMILRDLRDAIRLARRYPLFTVTAIVTLSLGIGANTAIFQLIDAVRLRMLPVHNPHELVEVKIAGGNGGFGINPGRYTQLTRPIWRELRERQQAFSGTFAWAVSDMRVGERTDLQRVEGIAVSGDFFRVLGIQPWRGRLIEPADADVTCPSPRVVLGHGYWQRQLGGRDIATLPRLMVNGESHEIIGVAPPGFAGIAVGESFDVAIPLCEPPSVRNDVFDIAVFGRLRPGWTVQTASAHLATLSAGIFETTVPAGYGAASTARFKQFRLGVEPAGTGVSALRANYAGPLTLLLAMTGMVLLLACANLANLMLSRAVARDREMSVRLALGASRAMLVRQALTESALLAASGALLGVLLAQAGSRVLLWALSTDVNVPSLTLTLDWRLLAFAGVVAMGTCVVFGVAPAVRATRIPPAGALKAGGRGTAGGRFAPQRIIVIGQVAISLVLLVAALLFVRSFVNLTTFDPGVRQKDVAVVFVNFNQLQVPRDRFSDIKRQILAEVSAVPGVIRAGTTSNVPLLGGSWGHGIKVDAVDDSAMFTWVSPGYFQTMNVPVVQGRDFSLQDTSSSTRVAVVNEAFVRRFSAGSNIMGRHLRTGPEPNYPSTVYEIVGVIPDTQYNSLRGTPPPMVFAPDSQHPSHGPWVVLMVHSQLEHAALSGSIRKRLQQVFPGSILEIANFEARVHAGLVRERLLAVLAGFFGGVAALLATIGLYGMLSFAVAQRRQEIGIRIALGAERSRVAAMIMREAGTLLLIAVPIGVALALAAGRSASAILFRLEPHDPVTLAAAIGLMAAVAAAASYIPARAAARLDPLDALRQE